MTELVGRADSSLRRLLLVFRAPLVEVVAAPAGLDANLADVVILDAEDEPGSYPGALVLVIGARGRSALRLVRLAARRGAAAVAVKVDPGDGLAALQQVAAEAGVMVLGVRPEVEWTHLEALARGALADVLTAQEANGGGAADLFTLAQTVAALAGGAVTIEDASNRVLAYSQSDDEVDELRRLSILGWQGPAEYLAMLRRWGVFEQLRVSDDVVEVESRPEFGIRRRMAIGIRVDGQMLGSIWVQEGSKPLADSASDALPGAARAAALQLVRRRTGVAPDQHLEQVMLGSLLDGHIDARTFAEQTGADCEKPVVVAAFALDAEADLDRSSLEMRIAMLANLVTVHASAYWRRSLVTCSGTRIYLLVPKASGESTPEVMRGLAQEIVRTAGTRLALSVDAGIGSIVPKLELVGDSRAEADRVLDVLAHRGGGRLATIADVRGEVLIRELLSTLDATPQLRDPRVAQLVAYDTEHDAGLVGSVLGYLGKLGNVRAAAEALHVHPNTLRYRLKRAESVSGIDLSDPYDALFAHLQLLLTAPHVHRRDR